MPNITEAQNLRIDKGWGESHYKSTQVTKSSDRPMPEFRKSGDTIQIRTGANVTHARAFGVSVRRAWSGFKNILQTITLTRLAFKFGNPRRTESKNRQAGLQFDAGINKIVEDLAAGKIKDPSQLSERLEGLYKNAERLMTKGGVSRADMVDRFRVNMMESLRALGAADLNAALQVREQLASLAFEGLEDHYRRPISNEDAEVQKILSAKSDIDKSAAMMNPEATRFAKDLIPSLRRSAVFGGDTKSFGTFEGSALMFQAFNGDCDGAKAFNFDPVAYNSFRGDTALRDKFGGSVNLHEKFGSRLQMLEGRRGAKLLTEWIDAEYGAGKGAAFMERNPEFRGGIGDATLLRNLGSMLEFQEEPLRGRPYSFGDITPKNVAGKDHPNLNTDFVSFANDAKFSQNLTWLRDLQDLRSKADTMDAPELRERVGKLMSAMKPEDGGNAVGPDGVNKRTGSYDNVTITYDTQRSFFRDFTRIATGSAEPRVTHDEAQEALDGMGTDELHQVINSLSTHEVSHASGSGRQGLEHELDGSLFVSIGHFMTDLKMKANNERTVGFYKQLVQENGGDEISSNFGDAYVETRIAAHSEPGGRQRYLNAQDLRKIEDRMWRAPSELSPVSIGNIIDDRKQNLPPSVATQWMRDIEKNGSSAPVANLRDTIDPETKYGIASVRSFMDESMDDDAPYERDPRVTKQFMKDVERSDVYIAGNGSDSTLLTSENASNKLIELADGDENIARNLSAFLVQNMFKGMMNAINGEENLPDEWDSNLTRSTFAQGGRIETSKTSRDQQLNVSSDDNGDFIIKYAWNQSVRGIQSLDGKTTYTNRDQSPMTASAEVRISRRELERDIEEEKAEARRKGSKEPRLEYELSPIEYAMRIELDPTSTALNN